MHGCLPSAMFHTPWPATVPLEVHAMRGDELVDVGIARELVAEAADGRLHLRRREDEPG